LRILERIILDVKENNDLKSAYSKKYDFENSQEEFVENRIML